VLRECRPLIRPGGHVVITCGPERHATRHELLDLPGHILALAGTNGLAPIALSPCPNGITADLYDVTAGQTVTGRGLCGADSTLTPPEPDHHYAIVLRSETLTTGRFQFTSRLNEPLRQPACMRPRRRPRVHPQHEHRRDDLAGRPYRDRRRGLLEHQTAPPTRDCLIRPHVRLFQDTTARALVHAGLSGQVMPW
jgi:hypothetical protein